MKVTINDGKKTRQAVAQTLLHNEVAALCRLARLCYGDHTPLRRAVKRALRSGGVETFTSMEGATITVKAKETA